MSSLKDLADARENMVLFKWDRLAPKPGLNGRDFTLQENIEHVEWLAENIRENGVREPLKIMRETDDLIWITNGESRWRACKILAERGETVPLLPCLPERKGTNDIDLILDQNISNSGKPFNAIEVGRNVKRAIAFGATPADIARKLGKSSSWVSHVLDFQAAPAAVHAAVIAGDISATEAAKIVREEGAAAPEIIKQAVETAKATGKRKATAKHVSRSANSATYQVKDVGGGLFAVTIDGKRTQHSGKFWAGLANEILAKVGAP